VLGAGVEPLALSLLKYGLLALLFLFLWRSMRWVVRGLSVDAPLPAAAGSAFGGPAQTAGGVTPALDAALPMRRASVEDGSSQNSVR